MWWQFVTADTTGTEAGVRVTAVSLLQRQGLCELASLEPTDTEMPVLYRQIQRCPYYRVSRRGRFNQSQKGKTEDLTVCIIEVNNVRSLGEGRGRKKVRHRELSFLQWCLYCGILQQFSLKSLSKDDGEGDGNETDKKLIGFTMQAKQLCTCITSSVRFFAATVRDVKFPDATFYGGGKHRTGISYFSP